uniref:Uncharacterized protein At2g02530 n=1 Tax=Arabidopsis thaliana TaxID=3702 RepID=O64723_ARATH|nr:hypothetical protein [Arabidopsis thaliana]
MSERKINDEPKSMLLLQRGEEFGKVNNGSKNRAFSSFTKFKIPSQFKTNSSITSFSNRREDIREPNSNSLFSMYNNDVLLKYDTTEVALATTNMFTHTVWNNKSEEIISYGYGSHVSFSCFIGFHY